MKNSSHVHSNTRSQGFVMSCSCSGLKCTKLACIRNIRSFVLSFVRSLVTTYVSIHMRACLHTTHISQQVTKRGGGMFNVRARTDPSDPFRLWHYSILLHCVRFDWYQSITHVTPENTINVMTAGLETSNLTFLCHRIAAICWKTRISSKNTTTAGVYIHTCRQNVWIFPIQCI